MGKHQPLTGTLAWARITDKRRDPNPMLRQDTDRACYLAQWVRGGGTLCSTISTRSMCHLIGYVLLYNLLFLLLTIV